MDNNNQHLEELEPKADKIKPIADSVSAPKVNSRVLAKNSWLAEHETLRPEKARILLPSMVNGGSHGFRNFIVAILVLSGLAYGGYQAYLKYGPQQTAPGNQIGDGSQQYANTAPPNPSGQVDSASSSPLVTDMVVPATTTPAVATSTPAATPPVTGKRLTINDNSLGYLNVRGEPASSGKLITKVHPGETYGYTDSKYDWYHITLPNGSTGWVSGQYVTVK